jgi:hypothetical protein
LCKFSAQSPQYILKNTALEIIKHFSRAQQRAFERFLSSPYFGLHEGAVHLYTHYKAALEAPEGAKLDKKNVEQSLSKTGKAGGRKVYDYNAYLLEALERFLAMEQCLLDPLAQHLRTTSALRKMKLRDEADAMLRYTAKKASNLDKVGSVEMRHHYELQYEAYLLSLQQGRSKTFNIMELTDAQDIALICEKLRMGCALLSHEALNHEVYDKGFLRQLLQFLDGHRFLEIPLVAVYYHGYLAHSDSEQADTHFIALKRLLQENGAMFATSELHDLYLMAINFCIRRINRQSETYVREVFDLYQSGLSLEALLEDQSLSRWTYVNITITALKLQEYDWLYAFLQDYAPLLPAEHREGALNQGLARYYYETKRYPEAMSALLRTEYDDVLQNLVAKVLLAKIYYECAEFDALENHLDSIQIYLRRKKVIGYHRNNYRNIIRYIRKMTMLRMEHKQSVVEFRAAVETEEVLSEKAWILKMLS